MIGVVVRTVETELLVGAVVIDGRRLVVPCVEGIALDTPGEVKGHDASTSGLINAFKQKAKLNA